MWFLVCCVALVLFHSDITYNIFDLKIVMSVTLRAKEMVRYARTLILDSFVNANQASKQKEQDA